MRATGLPVMDFTLLGRGTKEGIDAFARMRLGSFKALTPVISSQQPSWNVEFWIPVLLPTMGSLLELSVLDRDRVSSELVGKVTIAVDDVLTGAVAASTRWHQLYARPKAGLLTRAGRHMRTAVLRDDSAAHSAAQPSSEWRGSVLLRLALARPDERRAPLPERVMQRRLGTLAEPPLAVHTMQVAVVGGALANGDADGAQMHVEATLGEHVYRSERATVARGLFFLPEPGGGG
eukprot:4298582-Prymnesium_polylepis.1